MTTVLVVDDDLDIQLLLRLELTAEGFDVITADNGEAALAQIDTLDPDLVLLDVMMPVLDGWGVLERLDPDIAPPVIMVSAFISERDSVLERAWRLGAIDFVQKPFEPDHITGIIQRALAMTRDERRQLRGAKPNP